MAAKTEFCACCGVALKTFNIIILYPYYVPHKSPVVLTLCRPCFLRNDPKPIHEWTCSEMQSRNPAKEAEGAQ